MLRFLCMAFLLLVRPAPGKALEGELRSGEVSGGDIREFRSPEDYPGVEQYKDWVLYVVRR